MKVGQVTPDKEAIVTIYVFGFDDAEHEIAAILDTGYTEYLTLPPHTISALGLRYRYSMPMSMADGKAVNTRVFDVVVRWVGREHAIPVLETDGDVLLGMSMLYGSSLHVDVVDGGDVEIADLGVT